MRKTYIISGLVGFALLVFICFPANTSSSSDSKWLSGEQTLSDLDKTLSNLPNAGVQAGNLDCNEREIVTKQKFEFFGNSLPFLNKESHKACGVKANYGIWSSSGYLVRNGSVIGGGVYNSLTNSALNGFIAVPSSDHLLQTSGDNMRLYTNFSNYLKSIYIDHKVKHTFNISQSTSDYLKDGSGNRLNIFGYPLSFSANGKFLIAELRSSSTIIRYNLETNEYLPFAPGFNRNIGIDPATQYAISADGRYAVVASGPQNRFILYDLDTCVVKAHQIYKQCSSVDLLPLYKSKVTNFIAPSHIRFIDNYSLKLVLITKDAQGRYTFIDSRLTAAGHIAPSYGYLALGDSFASGEGAYEYKPGTDEKDPLNKCHISLKSYPFLLGKDLNLNQYESVSCSGAVLDDIGSEIDYITDRVKYPRPPQAEGMNYLNNEDYLRIISTFLPGYSPQLSFIKERKPSIITVSISGNDIGFGDIVKRCMLAPDNCYESYEDRYNLVTTINSQFQKLVDTYSAAKTLSPDAKIYAIGYPEMIKPEGDCANNVRASNDEAYFFNDLTNYLNSVIKKAADSTGVNYVDASKAFYGQRLCEGPTDNLAVNGFSLGDDKFLDLGPIGNESYHPNKTGHALLAKAINEQTAGLTKLNPASNKNIAPPKPEDGADLLKDRPYRGGRLSLSQGNIGFKYSFEHADASIDIGGFGPNAPIKLEILSEPTQLGEFTTDENGNLETDIDIPNSVEPGFHTIYAYGKDAVGQDIMASKFVYIPYSADDYDGDGLANGQDPCLVIEPSGEDVDKDKLDDACDPLIEKPPDTLAPVVVGSPDREPNENGWYKNDAAINWQVSDPEPSSGTPSTPVPTIASEDGDHTYTSEQSCDPANNCSSGTLSLRIDKIAPEIVFSLDPSPNSSGWNNSAVTVNFACNDETSGIASCSEPQTIEAEDGSYTIAGKAVDKAGNISNASAVIKIDVAKPLVETFVSPPANEQGWHNKDVSLESSCKDDLSGIAFCSPDSILSDEGQGQIITSTALDKAGNSQSTNTIINLDKTAPLLGGPTVSGCLPILRPCTFIATLFQQSVSFAVPAGDSLSGIVAGEYFIDNDPGVSKGVSMAFDGQNFSGKTPSNLAPGLHTIAVRGKDKAGNWSVVRVFVVRAI